MKHKFFDGWVIILGHSVPKVKIIGLISFIALLVLCCGIGGFFYVDHLKQETRKRISDWTSESPARIQYERRMDPDSIEATDPLEALLRFHVEATGFDRITSLRVGGRYIAGNIALDLTIMARSPDRFLQRLQYEDRQLTVGLVDGILWYRQNSPLLAEEDDDLTQVNRVLMIMECAIPFLAWQLEDDAFRTNLVRLPDDNKNGVEVAFLENHAFDGIVIRHEIDLRTGMERARTSMVPIGESPQLIELVFAPPIIGSEYPFPSEYTVRINQAPVCIAEFENYEFNTGIAPFLFDQP